MKSTAKRIKDFRKASRMTQADLAKKVGVTQSAVSKWEDGKEPVRLDMIERLAEVFGVEQDQFLGRNISVLSESGRRIPVVGKLAAGDFLEAIDLPVDDRYDTQVHLSPEYDGLFIQGFEVSGDSMNMYYPDGTVVYAAQVHDLRGGLRNKDHVVVMRRRSDGMVEGTLKEYIKDEDGREWLWPRSTSPEHQQVLDYRGKDNDIEEVAITGVVIAATIHRRR